MNVVLLCTFGLFHLFTGNEASYARFTAHKWYVCFVSNNPLTFKTFYIKCCIGLIFRYASLVMLTWCLGDGCLV